jgi:hypothetical protein
MRRKSVRRARISVATAKEVGGGFSWIDEPRGEKAVRRKVKTLEELLEGLLLASISACASSESVAPWVTDAVFPRLLSSALQAA